MAAKIAEYTEPTDEARVDCPGRNSHTQWLLYPARKTARLLTLKKRRQMKSSQPNLNRTGITANGMTRERFSTIDEYIAAFPEEVQRRLEQIRKTIHTAAPQAREAIKYNMPAFTLGKNLVYFAAFTKHIGFYPIPSAVTAFKNDLADFKQGKGSVQFPFVQPLPLELIRRIVHYRVGQLQQEAAQPVPRKTQVKKKR